MHLTGVLGFLAVALPLVSAAPATAVDAVPTQHFKIKTKAISGPNPDYDGLYMYGFHTGAGFNIPSFAPGRHRAPVFRFNDTRLLTNLFGEFPYGLNFGQVEDLYARWGATTLNTGYGSKGFALNNDGYIVSKRKTIEWKGWRVCDWVHGAPELYFDTDEDFNPPTITSNCELVHLVPDFVGS